MTMNATASTQFELYVAVRRTGDKRLEFMQSAWKGRGRRKNRESRLSGNGMRGNMGVPVINWKTFTFESEECGVDIIPKATLNNGRAIWAGRKARGIRE